MPGEFAVERSSATKAARSIPISSRAQSSKTPSVCRPLPQFPAAGPPAVVELGPLPIQKKPNGTCGSHCLVAGARRLCSLSSGGRVSHKVHSLWDRFKNPGCGLMDNPPLLHAGVGHCGLHGVLSRTMALRIVSILRNTAISDRQRKQQHTARPLA
jgi:hypothetical protein